jgi:selenocysteine-specific elongation factor
MPGEAPGASRSKRAGRLFVIGTVGHVDHGKSTLVEALTGIDPDRLQEEKARGMTIDLGFAWLKLPDGEEVSIVDVPGHERFIKNMLAGVGGIDLALLVIAADEGVMPQTREHLAILDLLGVERGVVVITKSDLVDKDWLDLVQADVEDVLKGKTLERAPIVSCSAVTGDGLEDLVRVIEAALADTPPKRDLGRPRLPIDRAFTVAGFGTVVTGTLVDGALSVGQEVEVLPAVVGGHVTSLKTRIRSLQTHRTRVERASPGTRTAANLVGINPDDLYRGQVVTTPGWLRLSEAVDVRFRALESLTHGLRHNLHVTFHSGASETPARLRLLEADEVAPGEEAWAQVKLLRPVPLLKGDRFVLRDANTTIGGGVVVETQARRHPRRRVSVVEALERQATGSEADLLLGAIGALEPAEARAVFARTDLPRKTAEQALEELIEEGRAVRLGAGEASLIYTAETFARLTAKSRDAIAAHLKDKPLRRGLAKEELRSRLALSPRIFALAVQEWVHRGEVVDAGPLVSLPGWEPRPTSAQQRQIEDYLALLRSSPYTPPVDKRPSDEVVAYVVESGKAVDVGAGVVFAAEAYEDMVSKVVGLTQASGKITLAEVRDMFGASRRYVQAFLEHLDEEKITRRVGDERVLGPAAPKP